MASYFWPPQNGSASGVTSLNGLTGALTLVAGSGITITPSGSNITIAATGGTGTVTSVSVVSANGFAGSVATATTTPAITLTTTITGILQGNGTAISAATTGNLTDAGTDGIVVTGGTGAVLGSGTSLAQHVADSTHNGYLSSADWTTFNSKQSALSLGDLTDAGTDGIIITGGTGAVVGAGTTLAQHVADATHNGYLSSSDWSTFNNKQPAGSYITALTGDVTAAGPGSAAATLANVGTAGTYVKVTTNTKGLVTSGSVAPLGPTDGGTGQTTYSTGDILYASASNTLSKLTIGSAGQILTVASGIPSWAAAGSSVTSFSFNNNQVAFSDVTGFLVAPSSSRAFRAEISVERTTTTGTPVFVNEEDSDFYTALGTGFNQLVFVARELSSGGILVGGLFTALNGNTHNYFVKLNSDGTEDTSFNTNLGTAFDNDVRTIVEQPDNKILVGGSFGMLNGNTRAGLVRLNADGTEDATFYSNFNGISGTVLSVGLLSDQSIIVGGGFTMVGATTSNYIAKLDSAGNLDGTFNSNIGTGYDGNVNSVGIQTDDSIVAGGTFQNFNGSAQLYLSRLDLAGNVDSSFYTNLGSSIAGGSLTIFKVLVQTDQNILFGGQFTSFNGNTRNRLVRLDPTGAEDTAFYTALGSAFDAGVVDFDEDASGNITLGGSFTAFNGNTRNRIVQLDSSGAEVSAFYASLGSGFNNIVRAVSLQSNAQILIGGQFTALNGATRNSLVRYGTYFTPPANDLISVQSIKGVYHSSSTTWMIGGFSILGDNVGVSFQMTNAGQLQYTSSNLTGTAILNTMTFEILEL